LNIEELRDYCLQKPGVTESFPFGEDTLVFKVGDKIFLLTGLNELSFNAKCDPELAVELREQYNEVKPGYHMNKKHWNTIYTDGSLTNKQLREMVDHSYELVFASLPKKLQAEITVHQLTSSDIFAVDL
jgi:predicted DNA-binding protein (MmcQ/YjbR family)